MPIARLDRSVIALLGDDVEDFLSGIITNNLEGDISFAALLTPQGKIIADFFVTKVDGGLWLDTPSKFGESLLKRLKMYKLRAKFELKDISDEVSVYAMWDGEGDEGHADPRHSQLGRRIITSELEATASGEAYNAHRLALGIPDSLWDFVTTSVFPADANMDILRGVDYQKGCFVGQEVVSRMHRKSTKRKRMCGFSFDGEPDGLKGGDSLMLNDKPVGTVLSVQGDRGMAIIRMDRLGAIRDLVSESGGLVFLDEVTHAD